MTRPQHKQRSVFLTLAFALVLLCAFESWAKTPHKKTSHPHHAHKTAKATQPATPTAAELVDRNIKDQKWDEAETAANAALKLEPNSAPLHVKLAQILNAKGKIQDAMTEAKLAQSLDPTFAQAYFIEGVLLFQSGRFRDASAPLNKTVVLSPTASAVFLSGLNDLKLGNEESGVKSLKRATQADPELCTQLPPPTRLKLQACARTERGASWSQP